MKPSDLPHKNIIHLIRDFMKATKIYERKPKLTKTQLSPNRIISTKNRKRSPEDKNTPDKRQKLITQYNNNI